MWNLTIFLNNNIKMYEFCTEEEARTAMKELQGYMILSEILVLPHNGQ